MLGIRALVLEFPTAEIRIPTSEGEGIPPNCSIPYPPANVGMQGLIRYSTPLSEYLTEMDSNSGYESVCLTLGILLSGFTDSIF